MPQCVACRTWARRYPGCQNRMVPNWNGYQAEPDPANPGQLKLVLRTPNYLTAEEPFMVGPARLGCMYDGAYDGFVQMSMTSQNGGNDMTNTSTARGSTCATSACRTAPSAHPLSQGGNGLRQIGGYQTGGIARGQHLDRQRRLAQAAEARPARASTTRWSRPATCCSTPRWTAGWSAATPPPATSCGASRRARRAQAGTISYMVNGEQYIATTNMAGSQPYSQGGNGDAVWAFKLGGTAKYHTGTRSAPTIVSGSSEAPAPLPIANWRRPVDNTAAGIVPANEIWMARSNSTATSTAGQHRDRRR